MALIRFVTMRFQPEQLAAFHQVFEGAQPKIAGMAGCSHVSLHEDPLEPYTLYTYSVWESEDHLNAYRHSQLFEDTWAQTKPKFRAKPSAMSWLLNDDATGVEIRA